MKKMAQIPCLWMRGGTSKGAYFLADELPKDQQVRDHLLLRAMGSPDLRQIDGLGGGDSLSSKVAIISPSDRKDIDVDYLFAQVVVDQPIVDTSANCGNILSGVGPFAILRGLVAASDSETVVRIYNINTGSRIHARVQTPDGKLRVDGQATIDGVPGTAAPIQLDFLDVLGPLTGSVTPTGAPREEIEGVPVTCIDSANPVVLMHATDVGESGHETPETLDHDHPLMVKIESIRQAASLKMGLGDATDRVIPKIALLSPPTAGGSICSRYFTPKHCHAAHAITGAIAIAIATTIPGSVAEDISVHEEGHSRTVTIEHPSGHVQVILTMADDGTVSSAGIIRTARPIMDGILMVPNDQA
ncbi:MAG: 4-oxalomesaconate tautomerase [Phycisphaerales bacterium]|nr:4-oxalomesaconate tautomerase [Phycisphaerales bacterium]